MQNTKARDDPNMNQYIDMQHIYKTHIWQWDWLKPACVFAVDCIVNSSNKTQANLKLTAAYVDYILYSSRQVPINLHLGTVVMRKKLNQLRPPLISSEKSQNRDGEEDAALDLVMDRLKFYRKEYKRLLKENGELWEENQKIKTSYAQLKVHSILDEQINNSG